MSHKKDYIRELDKLYKKRTGWLRSVIGIKRPGPIPHLSRKTVDRGIENMQGIASLAFANKLARREFALYAPAKSSWHVKGFGRKGKRELFDKWYQRRFGPHKGCVYVFWGKPRKCVYIGRTGGGGSRPDNHFEKFWFGGVRRIDIYPVKQASQLPKLECLAIHRFQPARNKVRAAKQKWTKRCPMCKIHRDIHRDLRRIYRFR